MMMILLSLLLLLRSLGLNRLLLQHCGDKFSVEPVDVTYDDNSSETQTTPLLSTRTEEASVAEICSIIGVEVRRDSRQHLSNRPNLSSFLGTGEG